MATEATSLKINPAAAQIAIASGGGGGGGDASPAAIEWKDKDTPVDEEKRDAMEKRLWYWNLACCLAHAVQAAAALAIGQGSGNAGKFRIPLTTQFLNWDQTRGYPVTELTTRQLVPFVSLTSGFAWMSAVAHLIVLLSYKQYTSDLRKGINQFRWFEYALSSSLMIALIAMLFGMYDIVSLLLLASVNACMNLFGYMMELHNATTKKVDWTSFWFGCFAGMVPWVLIITYVVGSGVASKVPAFVWAILVVYFVAFNTFPVNMIYQYLQKGWWSDRYHGWRGAGYYFGERAYQIQSLVSKSLLLWLVVGGSNQPSQYTGGS